MDQVCITSTKEIIGAIATVIAAVNYFNNLIPAPDTINNPALRLISRVLHFIGGDIVTSVKK